MRCSLARTATPRRGLTLLLAAGLLCSLLAPIRPARAATFDLTVCNPDPLLNGASLIAAITTANANGQDDTITLGACTYLLNSVNNNNGNGDNGLPLVLSDGLSDLTIDGAGPATVIGRAGGAPAFRLFEVGGEAALTLQDVTVRDGLSDDGGGALWVNDSGLALVENVTFDSNSADGRGGGAVLVYGAQFEAYTSIFVNNSANGGGAIATVEDGSPVTLFISETSFRNNTATQFGGGAVQLYGSEMGIEGSTFSGNTASGPNGNGGAILARGGLLITNSTISGNSAGGRGGGIFLLDNDGAIAHVTIADNTAAADGGGLAVGTPSFGPGAFIDNTLIATNSAASNPDVSGTFNTLGTNLIGDGTGGNYAAPDLVGTPAAPIDPLLGPLQDNGGPTSTHALLPGSPAINAGDQSFSTPPDNDQRGVGFPRVSNGRIDIGALERQFPDDAPVYASAPPAGGALVLTGPAGVPVDASITITNIGAPGTQLHVTSATPSAGFSITTPLPSGLFPGDAPQPLGVRCTPSAAGTQTGTLTVTTNEPGAPAYTYTLSCVPLSAGVDLKPNTLDFGNQRVGTTSAVQIITLTNSGQATLTVTGIQATGDFAVVPGSGASPCPIGVPSFGLPAGQSCTIGVSFTPSAPGARTGALSIVSNAPGSPHTASLTGFGTTPSASLLPSPLDFGLQTVGTTSGARAVTVRNTGDADLTVSGVAVSGEFALVAAGADACPAVPPSFTLPPGGFCTIALSFTPTAVGPRAGTLTVSNDGFSSAQTVALSGTGTLQAVPNGTIEPFVLEFGPQPVGSTSATQIITLTSTGTAPLTVDGMTTQGDFAVVPGSGAKPCPVVPPPFTLAPGESCTIGVSFTPAAAGTQYGGLIISSNVVGGLPQAGLIGRGADLTANTTYLPIVLRTGQVDLVITAISISPDRRLFTAGEPVTVSVTVTNQGNAPTTSGFWVDLYVNPARQPTVNTLWSDVCGITPCVGVAWPVSALLAPGQSITLTTTRTIYDPSRSFWLDWLPAGTTRIYALADNWNTSGTSGAVLESNEANNGASIDGLTVTGTNPPYQPWPNAAGARPNARPTDVPARPPLRNQD
ncbi:MAG TPA: choice-of-anchor D domain-containing protein [Roseiflexaceae bacterium]|nr:choice-of-anchor D domain-containing protein [Roseiflexaceae bacterium]